MRSSRGSAWCALMLLASAHATAAHAALAPRAQAMLTRADAWTRETLVRVGSVDGAATPLESAGDILAVYASPGDQTAIRVSLVAPVGIRDGVRWFERGDVRVVVLLDDGPGGSRTMPERLPGVPPIAWERAVVFDSSPDSEAGLVRAESPQARVALAGRAAAHLERGWLAAVLPASAHAPQRLAVITLSRGRELDREVVDLARALPTGTANVAFVHHANQGLAYTNFFAGRAGAEGSSGYDEILRVHETENIPGNFHVEPLLQTVAEWNTRNGDPLDFNAWLRTGGQNGWAAILASAYAQPITPFLQGSMNDWAIDRHVAMTSFRYAYTPKVAWVPERVWLTPGQAPAAAVIDGSAARWKSHGIDGVILDDWPHCSGFDNHQIHFVPGNGLRVIPRDGNFTGRLHAGDGAGALQILTDLANGPNGPYRLVTYADDWEMAAGVAGWETTFPFATGTYLWMIDKCSTESAWLATWKLDAALVNPNFNGATFSPTNGTYGGIGDVNGYGGNDNAWYTDYAGFVPYSTGGNGTGGCGGGGNCRNHGQLWNDAHFALQAAPSNSIREAGWYVLMTNLHETGWHDGLGGALSGWQRKYGAHIKNANVYAEAARWAGGLYASATGAFFSDIDNDGVQELVAHNDRVYAVFEPTGGRCAWLFAKGPGYEYSVVGVDNAYWYGTEGDYNDGNHVAALSDVSPNQQNDPYTMSIVAGGGTTVQVSLARGGLTKTIALTAGDPFMVCTYRAGSQAAYVQSGWTPDLVDLLYNAEMTRLWGGSNRSYAGQRNPNTGATAACVLGDGGAQHNLEFASTLMKGDEIFGAGKFQFLVYAGPTSAPNGFGQVPELDALSAALGDALAPEAVSATYFPVTRQLAITFDEAVQWDQVAASGIAIDDDDDGIAEATLDGGTTVLTTSDAGVITLQVSNAVHAAIAALDHGAMRLLLAAAAVRDVAGNGNAALTNAGDVFVSYGPPTLVTLDGRFDPSEWPDCAIAVADSFDSQWNAGPTTYTNEIQAVYATWDSAYLYLGIRGVVTSNSWLLYLDTDPGGPNGQQDLRTLPAWERGVQITAPGFRADWQFGAYQHQGPFDSQSFFRITGPSGAEDSTAAILHAFDPQHANGLHGGSEIAIPWGTLYGLGPDMVPTGAQLGLIATLCYDPEPAGEAGGDQAPSNTGSVLPPTLNQAVVLTLDANSDGLPDPIDRAGPQLVSAAATAWDSVVTVQFDEDVSAASADLAAHWSVYETGNPAVTVPVLSAALQPDLRTVVLAVDGLLNRGYTVAASDVADATCWANRTVQAAAAFAGPTVGTGADGRAPRLALSRPYPNPSRGGSTIEFVLPAHGTVAIELYDLGGRHVRTLLTEPRAAGAHRVTFDGRSARGDRLAPGLYFVRLSAGGQNRIQRLVLLP